jgi:GntR family transcriptional regulator/MocR family aminotransferase
VIDLPELASPERFRHEATTQKWPLQKALYEVLKQAIVAGKLLPGASLPGSREMAQAIGISRNGVIHAYELLATEGHVQSSRQGTVVAAMERAPQPLRHGWAVHTERHNDRHNDRHVERHPGRSLLPSHECQAWPPLPGLSRRTQGFNRRRTLQDDLLPLMPGIPALDAFPRALWHRLTEQARKHSGVDALSYRDTAGEPELRQAIATYLRAARGVQARADQVFITDGTQQALELSARLLADVGDVAWIEHPGYGGARAAFAQSGLQIQPITVDMEGIHPPDAWWHERTPKLIYTTPSHQYPLGPTLTLARRLHLIERARLHGAWIIEDDYDSEFRHDGPPLAAMQGQAPDAPVVYIGTFSKTVFPALRLGFMVLPPSVADAAAGVIGAWAPRGHAIEQQALAAFIDQGHFTRHLRRMRRLYRERKTALQAAIERHWPLPGQVLGAQAGMHLVLSLPPDCPDHALAALAMQHGLSPRPLSVYGTGGISGFNGLVMGHANTPEADMPQHIRLLATLAAKCRA